MIQNLKNTLRDNLSFLIPFAVVWIVAFIFALLQTKAETHLIINEYHATWADYFFRYFTQIGGFIPWILIAVIFFIRYRIGLLLLTTQLVTGLFTQILKHIFAVVRPSVLLTQLGYTYHTIEGVSLHTINSFPSGHTASAFAMMFVISIICKKNWQKVLCLIVAYLAGFSRIYLSQHFLQDVLAGSVIGILSVLFVYEIQLKVLPKHTPQ